MPDTLTFDHTYIGTFEHLGFRRFMPQPHLQQWVQCYWTAQNQLAATSFIENIYPDGGTSLTIDFSNTLPDIIFIANQAAGTIHFQGTIDRLGIRFRPGGAFQLLGLDMPAMIGKNFSCDHLGVTQLQELQHQLADTHQTSMRLRLIDNWLLQQASRLQAQTGLVQQLLPQLIKIDIPIASLSEELAFNRRKLERKFQQEVGFSPAQYKLLHRIKMARYLISIDPLTPLTDIAYQCGFYDQAHFIHQFQKVTGQTPGQYKKKKMSQKYNPLP